MIDERAYRALDIARSMTYGEQLARAARTWPNAIALRHGPRSVTFAELDARVTALARSLSHCGVRHGDRVAVLMFNRPEVIESYLAAMRLGAIAVPVNFRSAPDEIAYIIDHAEARVLVLDEDHGPVASQALGLCDQTLTVLVVGDPECVDAPSVVGYPDQLDVTQPDGSVDAVAEDDPAMIMYTSGTTGRSKGAVLTHRNILMNSLMQLLAQGGITPKTGIELLSVPLFHIAGATVALRSLLTGGQVVMNPANSFDARQVVDLLEQEQVTSCFFVPSQWAEICAVPRVRDRKFALRQIFWGAAPAPPSVLHAMADTFPQADAFCGFGQTEMSPTTCLLRGEDAIRKIGSVGQPLPLVEVRIVDELMNDVAVGQVGEIVYRGPTVMREYWRDEIATAKAFEGGWFHSGDLCSSDEDGFIWLVDRKKDMIISGGENIYCAEVEAAIDGHPGVAQVAVVGVPHERWGETPVAVVVPTDPSHPPTEREIIEHCRRLLASYKKPTRVLFVEMLPRTSSGKVAKFKLRETVVTTP